jgi:hypothetical protein
MDYDHFYDQVWNQLRGHGWTEIQIADLMRPSLLIPAYKNGDSIPDAAALLQTTHDHEHAVNHHGQTPT